MTKHPVIIELTDNTLSRQTVFWFWAQSGSSQETNFTTKSLSATTLCQNYTSQTTGLLFYNNSAKCLRKNEYNTQILALRQKSVHSINHQNISDSQLWCTVWEPVYIPWALNTGTCIGRLWWWAGWPVLFCGPTQGPALAIADKGGPAEKPFGKKWRWRDRKGRNGQGRHPWRNPWQ